MSLKHNFSKSLGRALITLVFFHSAAFAISEQEQFADLIVKGKVSKGTCSFAFSNKVVEFSKPLVSADIGDITDKNTPFEPFSIQYICQDYSDDILPELEVSIRADGNSSTLNSKLYPKNNVTNAAFALSECHINNSNCSLIDFQHNDGNISFPVKNGENEKFFEARVVRLNEAPIQSGKLSASVIFSFVQP